MQIRLAELSKSEDQIMASLAIRMKNKIDEHWGELYDLNPLLVVAMVLDPRYKLKGVKFCLGQAVNNCLKVEAFIAKVESTLVCLYEHYIASDSNSTNDIVAFSTVSPPNPVIFRAHEDYTKSIRDQFAKFVAEEGSNHEVTQYLSDSCEIHNSTFNLLGWWRLSSFRYPKLSRIARDFLAIPVCAAFYEEAFNTEFHELHPKLMSRRRDLREILIVGKDWFRENPPPADYKESWINEVVENDEDDEGEEDEGEEDEGEED